MKFVGSRRISFVSSGHLQILLLISTKLLFYSEITVKDWRKVIGIARHYLFSAIQFLAIMRRRLRAGNNDRDKSNQEKICYTSHFTFSRTFHNLTNL